MNKKTVILGVIGVVIIGLLLLSQYLQKTTVSMWKDTSISCLPNGHENLYQHIHQSLTIRINGELQPLPGNLGVAPGCMAEIHTHEGNDTIHVESTVPRTYVLNDFFTVYEEPLNKEGYTLVARVNGEVIDDPANVVLVDQQTIELEYTSAQ